LPSLVAVIITKNEAHNIADCIVSLRDWVQKIVVWDSGSTDGTCEIAWLAGALVVQRPFDHFAAQRQAVLDTIVADWILFVDADERATPALAHEVQHLIEHGDAVGYWIPRRNWIVGHEMRYGGFAPDYQMRLLKRSAVSYPLARKVHEVVEVAGSEGYLTEPLIHYNYTSWAQFQRKQRIYAAYEAHILTGRGVHPRPHNFVLQPLREFYRRFVTLRGWQDGWPGLRLALLLAWYYGFTPYWLLLTGGDAIDKEAAGKAK